MRRHSVHLLAYAPLETYIPKFLGGGIKVSRRMENGVKGSGRVCCCTNVHHPSMLDDNSVPFMSPRHAHLSYRALFIMKWVNGTNN